MKYIKIFNIEIGRYGWVRYDIPAYSLKYGYEHIYYLIRFLGLSLITNIKMLNKGEFNTYEE